jgi:beta-galactosidase
VRKALLSRNVITALSVFISVICPFANAAPYVSQNSNRVEIELDTGWLYNPTDVSNGQSTSLSENGWTSVCVPHANVITKHAFQSESAFRFISWYRRHIIPSSAYSGRRFLLEFEGVSINATVYVNGQQMGIHPGGYTPFTIDVTDRITVGQDNLIAVRVDSRQQSAVPPEGGNLDFMIYGGIVRNVNLIITDPLYVEWIFVSTQNPSQTAPTNPTVTTRTRLINKSASAKSATVITNIVDKSNNVVATLSSTQSVPANGSSLFTQTTPTISNPTLWSIDNPYLYNVYTQVRDGSTYVDEYRDRMGIRSITMNKTTGGFYINGQMLKLRGLNRHETSHYPQAPDFLDRCDEIGLLVLEEVPGWMYVGGTDWQNLEMQVLKDMIVRDRNHPSIFTFGVRINESADNNAFYQTMNDTARAYDPTRLTCGIRRSNSDPATSFLEDIWTQNFIEPSSSPPNMPIITTESVGHGYPTNSFSREDSLIELINQHGVRQNNSYSQSKWGGMLGWCAFDYASSHNNAVANNGGRYVSNHGMADQFRINKFAGYFFQSQRDPSIYGPMIYICNFWRNNSPSTIRVVSNCDQVELFVNTTSKGKINPNSYTSLPQPVFEFTNTPTSGYLKADGYMSGNKVVSQTWYTPATPTKITLRPDTSTIFTGGDMTRVQVMVADANNPFVPYNTTSVTLSASGAGDFIGESPIAMENGMSAFFVRSRASQIGTITCSATASGLTAGSANITVVKKPGDVAVKRNGVTILAPSIAQKSLFKQVNNSVFSVPAWARKNAILTVYDLSGKMVYRTDKPGRVIDFNRIGIAGKVYLVALQLQ